MRLYSYCLRYDDGAAPNPYWGLCTLVVCKPVIRRTANVGDWVVGLGSRNSPLGDISEYVMYAMKVTEKMTLQEYDGFCQSTCPNKIPDWKNRDYRRRVGDCIYDYSGGLPPRMREGVHDERNKERDLGGESALLSDHFYYFGDKPVRLPRHLEPIMHETQGHKSRANDPYRHDFVSWINSWDYKPNSLYGSPQLKLEMVSDPDVRSKCAQRDVEEHDLDEVIGECPA